MVSVLLPAPGEAPAPRVACLMSPTPTHTRSSPQTPMQVQEGDIFELQVWRVVGPRDVWYEWAVTSPRCTPIHNANGHAFKMGL